MKQLILVLFTASLTITAHAASLLEQWKAGLSGARLTSYAGSNVSSNSSLTVINFCRNGRYHYHREASWSVPGQAGGASNQTITGTWDVQIVNTQALLTYKTDSGDQGAFAMYLQNNGRVNIGGEAYAIEQNRSGC